MIHVLVVMMKTHWVCLALTGLANNAMDAKRSWTSVYEEDDENEANANNETDAKENENSVPVESRWV